MSLKIEVGNGKVREILACSEFPKRTEIFLCVAGAPAVPDAGKGVCHFTQNDTFSGCAALGMGVLSADELGAS